MGPVTRTHYPKYTLVEQSSIEAWQGVAEAKYEMPPSSDRRYLRHGTTGTTARGHGKPSRPPHGALTVPTRPVAQLLAQQDHQQYLLIVDS